MEGDYVYRPLSRPQNIRVLKLEPAQELEDTLIGHLEEIDPEVVEYDALSYSWAMEDGNIGEESMVLDECHILIGQNLRDALRRLRQMPTAEQAAIGLRKQPCRIWVDALCINQRDDLDKSVQVAMMASIYRNAATVVAWLGDGDKIENKLAFKAIQCLAFEAAMHKPSEHFQALSYIHKWTHDYEAELDEGREQCPVCRNMEPEPGEQDDIERALISLTLRRYFKRLWVVQEVATRSRDQVMFQWGAYKQFSNLLRLFEMFHMEKTPSLPSIRFKPVSYRLGESPAWSLEEWMQFCARKRCFDDRDHVYGLLGCVEEVPLQPNYRKSATEVYTDFARYLLKKRCFVTILVNAVQFIHFNRLHGLESRGIMVDGWPTWLLNPRQITPFKLYENQATSAATWDYAQPSMDEQGLMLSCHMAYQGTIASDSSADGQLGLYEIIWEAQYARDGSGSRFLDIFGPAHEHDELKRGRKRFITYDPTAVLKDEAGKSDFRARLEVGDVLCDFTPCLEGMDRIPGERLHAMHSLVLRRTERPGFWRIIDCFDFAEGNYLDPAVPKERRLYHLV